MFSQEFKELAQTDVLANYVLNAVAYGCSTVEIIEAIVIQRAKEQKEINQIMLTSKLSPIKFSDRLCIECGKSFNYKSSKNKFICNTCFNYGKK